VHGVLPSGKQRSKTPHMDWKVFLTSFFGQDLTD
jgi:hypothetical protein